MEDSKNPIVVNPKSALSIEKALEIFVRQMRASGLRERTAVHDYETYVVINDIPNRYPSNCYAINI
ncbi:hypothetical protein ACQKMI_02735 [Lysinibacillus sp. NPDC097214]|uniref:hypothetical protein n=1 Tax=Lysinibacillus sp. NPDC097214 TaxID=3390584 RepID=UPI003D0755D5